jgi:glucose/arabinose dehydrogenase
MPKKIAHCFSFIAAFVFSMHVASAALPAGFVDITLAHGVTNGSCLAVAPDGRVFVGHQNGLVRVIKNGALLPTPFISVSAVSSNELGLLGMAFDPGFATNNFIYLHYSTNILPRVQRISRFTASGDVAIPGSEMVLIETDPFVGDEEAGGGLCFGPDGMLYIGIGDCEVPASVQVTNSLFGKVLRIRRDGSIPADNPFFAQNTDKNRAVWALGFRNPFFLSANRTGRLFANDVGSVNTTAREEVNDVVRGGNYGWPTCEGNCANPAFRNPVHFITHTNNFAAITGGALYDPPAPLFPASYVGKYFFGELTTATIQLLDPATSNAIPFATGLLGGLISIQIGPDGALYYLVRSQSSANSGSVGKIISGVGTLVPLNSTWKYLEWGTNPPANWTDRTFDDNSWSNGVAQLGWGNNAEATIVRSNRADASRLATTYFRKSFVLSNTAPYSNYVVGLVRDDGGVVYLNGTEVFRNNMPAGAVTSTTLATFSVANPDEPAIFGAVVNPSLVLNGTNVLAVEIHQNATNAATDMSFNAALYGINGTANLNAFLSGNNMVISYPSWANRFTLEAAAAIPTISWSAVTNVSVVVSNELRVNVPLSPSNQFFRLRGQ